MDETRLNFNMQSNRTINNTEEKTFKVRTTGMKKNQLCWRVLLRDRNWDQKWFSRGTHCPGVETSRKLWSLPSWLDIKGMKSLACATRWPGEIKKPACWWCFWSSRDRKGEGRICKTSDLISLFLAIFAFYRNFHSSFILTCTCNGSSFYKLKAEFYRQYQIFNTVM